MVAIQGEEDASYLSMTKGASVQFFKKQGVQFLTLRKFNLLIINVCVFIFAKEVIFTKVNLLIINVDFFENKCKCLHLKKLNTW